MKYLYLLIFSVLFINNNSAQRNNTFPKCAGNFLFLDLTNLEFDLLYIGDYKEKIFKNLSSFRQHSGLFWQSYYDDNTDIKTDGIEIFFDLTQELEGMNGFPILLNNPTVDTLSIGYGKHLDLIVEALDTNGLWIPLVIKEDFLFCGTGLYPIVLTPNTIALTFYQLNDEGDYSTELRFKLGDNYSETFKDKIFLNQLNYYSDE